jgi:hypothetical protein
MRHSRASGGELNRRDIDPKERFDHTSWKAEVDEALTCLEMRRETRLWLSSCSMAGSKNIGSIQVGAFSSETT